tara:strand:+ start:4219 stop:4512 length:294 start_codon:yes stop_codon:yes gene_type:complete
MSYLFDKVKRKRNKDGTFTKDNKYTFWNEAWEYKMSDELKQLIEKVVWTFIEAFGSALLVGPALDLDVSAIQAAGIAGGGAVIVVLKEYAKKQLAGK